MTVASERTLAALEAMTDPVAFEMLCAEILASHPSYTGLVPQGVGRRDGGKDAIRRILDDRREQAGQSVSWLTEGQVFHFSLRQDVERKVGEDLVNTHRHGLQPQLVVFVSSRRCPAEQQDKLKAECLANYGWTLEILDQEWLRLHLDTDCQPVRKRYLHIPYDITVFKSLGRVLDEPRRHPNRRDLESGAYYRRPRLHDALARQLDEHRAALVIGPPGHGKTALALAYGWDWRRDDPRREVFYLSARLQHDWQQWEQAVHAYDQPHALFIVDDAHLAPDAASQFSSARHDFHRARILLVSRPLDPSLLGGEEDSYLEHLAGHQVEVSSQAEEWAEIVHSLAHPPEAPNLGDAQRLLNRCQGDLHLLRHLLNAWLKLPVPKPELADVPEAAVDQDVVARYLGDSRDTRHALLTLAAFGQYEIPVETAWLSHRPGFREMLGQGWADLDTRDCYGQPKEFAAFFHSTPARLLLRAFHRLGRLGEDVATYTLACLRDYLDSLPGNAVELLSALYRNGQAAMQGQLLTPDSGRRMLEVLPADRWDGLGDASRLLYALWRQEGSPEAGGQAHALWHAFEMRITLGHTANESLNPWSARWFLTAAKKLDAAHIQDAYARLDYSELGQRSRDVGLATVMTFLNTASRAGVDKAELRAFCQGLDFTGLGQRSRDVGLATVMTFLNTASRAGVDKADLRAFCQGLDFTGLGQRSRDVGLATVKNFLSTASRAGVDKAELRAYCQGLDFAGLGLRSRDVGLSTVMVFMQKASLAGVDPTHLAAFASPLDWHGLGNDMRPDEPGRRRAYLAELSWAAKNPGITQANARAFVEGWGWEDINVAVDTWLSPDGLAALLDLLRNRCGYSYGELARQGIQADADALWLRAFRDHPGGRSENLVTVQSRYFTYALCQFDSALRRTPHFWLSLGLRQWNLLTHNLALADPERLESQVWPAMQQITPRQWAALFEQADTANLGTFLSRFGPEGAFAGRSLKLVLPQPRALAAQVRLAPTLASAHLLINLWWVQGGSAAAAGLVNVWREDARWLPEDMHEADLRALVYLSWGACLAVPAADWLARGALAEVWHGRLDALWRMHEGAVEDWLGVAGIYALASLSLPWSGPWFTAREAEQRLSATLAAAESEILRCLAGYLALFPGQITPTFRQAALTALRALPACPEIPQYEWARSSVVAGLSAPAPVPA